MSLLFYFNGFNSAIPEDYSDNEKVVAVECYAARTGRRFRPFSVDYRRAAEHVEDLLILLSRQAEPVIFSGSSMGGWFARIMQLKLAAERPGLGVAAFAFNPAFDLARHGQILLGPQVNFVTGESYEWGEDDCERVAALEQSVDYDAPLPFHVYVDKEDEVIDWRASAARHAGMSSFTAFEGGSHHFEHAAEALEHLEKALGASPGVDG
ncbi:MAG: YqiA/YcfP family alpha/beta fold hydrolase [Lysobacterales bacterium]|jgi:predicted esterase YcpF (UPF0227 family)